MRGYRAGDNEGGYRGEIQSAVKATEGTIIKRGKPNWSHANTNDGRGTR